MPLALQTMLVLVLLSLFAVLTLGTPLPESPVLIAPLSSSVMVQSAKQYWEFHVYDTQAQCVHEDEMGLEKGDGSQSCRPIATQEHMPNLFHFFKVIKSDDCDISFYEQDGCQGTLIDVFKRPEEPPLGFCLEVSVSNDPSDRSLT